MVSDIEIMNRGIHCLLEKLGVVETEGVIAVINRERFDNICTDLCGGCEDCGVDVRE